MKYPAFSIFLIPGLIFLGSLLYSCQKIDSHGNYVREFIMEENYQIQLVAEESMLHNPMALSFDHDGRIWVVELPGYMRDIDGSDELKKDGKIIVLTDQNKDGVMDSRQTVLDSLEAPRTLLHAYGGLLYSDGTKLWWAKLNGINILEKVLVDSFYVVGGNIEHQPNGLLYNLDNWIYSASAKARYRFIKDRWVKEATSFRGQWGLSNDQQGRLYYNNNSLPIAADDIQLISCLEILTKK